MSFLFTDIEGSTELLQKVGDETYRDILEAHHQVLRGAFARRGGREINTQGDAFFVAFPDAGDAVAAAIEGQMAIAAHTWPAGAAVRVRMGIHTGEPTLGPGGYVGIDVHRAARICSAGYGGQVLLSESTRGLLGGTLPPGVMLRDLGEHRLKDLARPEHIYQPVIPGLPAEFPPLKSLDVQITNLPALQLTSFIGREREIEEIKRLLAASQVVTLTGAGGSGKTRLALQVGADLLERFAKGVWLVELTPLADPGLVAQTVASVFGVREVPERPLLDTLVDYLRTRELLLILDNCEHLVEEAARVAASLVRYCPRLRVLTTSREALGINGEVAYRVPPLTRPSLQAGTSPDDLMRSEAARLFIERAVASNPRFVATEANAPAIAQVVHRLDGIPLAIELAAARTKVLSVEQIARRLDDRFRLLTGGSRTGLPHHQTLRAAVAWSYDLLTEAERVLFRWLSVFAGSFTLEAVEAVCAGDGSEPTAGVDSADALDLLTRLVDKSLVTTESIDHDVRYRMLETIGHYGAERLAEAGEADAVRDRHLAWCVRLAEDVEASLQGPDQMRGLDRLELDHDNVRAALERARAGDARTESGLRLAGALTRFWMLRGYLREGRDWLESFLARGQGGSDALRAKAAYGASVLAQHQGDHARAEALAAESLQRYEMLEDSLGTALALNVLGNVARHRGDYATATAYLERSLALSRQGGQRWALAEGLNILGLVARRQGDLARATATFEESLAVWRTLGDCWGLAASLAHQGVVARHQGDYARARALHEESLAWRRQLGDRRNIAAALSSLGVVEWYMGDYHSAATLFEESLALSRELGDRLNVAATLCSLGFVIHRLGDAQRAIAVLEEGLRLSEELEDRVNTATALCNLGIVVAHQGDYSRAATLQQASLRIYHALGNWSGVADCLTGLAWLAASAQASREMALRAARLLAGADEIRVAKGVPLPPSDQAEHDSIMAAVRAVLGDHAFASALAAGRTAPMDDLIAEATA
ncbi:MAG: tetratricopeptide repeat protein [Armatimonadota bacterium]|nr:tetratricopeptide repeat protein [Armatimonadota bacterium]